MRYSIRVQWEDDNTTQVYSSGNVELLSLFSLSDKNLSLLYSAFISGILSQTFGFSEKTNRSEVGGKFSRFHCLFVCFACYH